MRFILYTCHIHNRQHRHNRHRHRHRQGQHKHRQGHRQTRATQTTEMKASVFAPPLVYSLILMGLWRDFCVSQPIQMQAPSAPLRQTPLAALMRYYRTRCGQWLTDAELARLLNDATDYMAESIQTFGERGAMIGANIADRLALTDNDTVKGRDVSALYPVVRALAVYEFLLLRQQ